MIETISSCNLHESLQRRTHRNRSLPAYPYACTTRHAPFQQSPLHGHIAPLSRSIRHRFGYPCNSMHEDNGR